jgi:hypothetical protein
MARGVEGRHRKEVSGAKKDGDTRIEEEVKGKARERMRGDKDSKRQRKKNAETHLIAPAAALGPNHMRTSLRSALPASAMRCTPNGAAGLLRNHERRRAGLAG